MTGERSPRWDVPGEIFGLSWQQEYRAARLVASASTDAADCALLLAALGIHPVDGLRSMIAPNDPEPAVHMARRHPGAG